MDGVSLSHMRASLAGTGESDFSINQGALGNGQFRTIGSCWHRKVCVGNNPSSKRFCNPSPWTLSKPPDPSTSHFHHHFGSFRVTSQICSSHLNDVAFRHYTVFSQEKKLILT